MADEQLYVITHIDLVPPHADDGRELLEQFSESLRGAPGLVRCDVLQQVFRKNHFEFVSVWRDDAAYEAHLAAPGTVEFRERLHPMLGAPFDDRQHRLHTVIG
jgi:quinol monooxygenase YgiN